MKNEEKGRRLGHSASVTTGECSPSALKGDAGPPGPEPERKKPFFSENPATARLVIHDVE